MKTEKKNLTIDEMVQAGVPEELAKFALSKKRNNRALNQEGMELGDVFTVKGLADAPSESTIDNQKREWADVLTEGDRNSISLSRLVGTTKRERYFAADREGTHLAEGFDASKCLTLPEFEAQAMVAVMGLKDHKFQVVAKAENCGPYKTTYYLFAEV